MVNYLKEKKWIVIIAVFCSILWGSAFPVLKLSYDYLEIESSISGKILLAGMRFFLAGIMIFSILPFIAKGKIAINKKEFGKLSMLGFLQTAALYFFFYIGLSNTTGMKASILSSAENFFVVIFAHYIYKNDRINKSKIIGLVFGFLGIIFANWGKSFGFEFTLTGEGFMIISAIIAAVATIYSKEICSSIHPFVANAYQMVIGSIILLVIGFLGKGFLLMHFNKMAIYLLIYSAFLSAIAFSLWYALLKYNKAGEITIYRFIIPVSGVILSGIFLPGEVFSPYTIISLICVAIGVISVNKGKR